MKWPNQVTFIRHGESAYNYLKAAKKNNPNYDKFCDLFDYDFSKAEDENWPSEDLKMMAKNLWQSTRLGVSDYNTPLTEDGFSQAKKTGEELSKLISIPEIIYVSPYLRTRRTFEAIKESWPELNDVKTVYEERIREQEHGVGTVFNDWRIFYTLNPIQGLLFKLEGEYEYRFLNGENKADVKDRVRSFLTTLIRENSEQNVLVISHHLTLLCLRANLERLDREQFMDIDKNEKPINCGVTIYKGEANQGKEGRLILDTYNRKLY